MAWRQPGGSENGWRSGVDEQPGGGAAAPGGSRRRARGGAGGGTPRGLVVGGWPAEQKRNHQNLQNLQGGGFVGFVGAPPGPFQKIQNGQTGEAEPSQAAIDRSVSTLNAAGVRIWRDTSTFVIGTWSDLDGRDVRAALQTLGTGTLPVRHLEDPGVPLRFKLRSVPERTRNRPTTQSQR